jgi:hypothetical protein
MVQAGAKRLRDEKEGIENGNDVIEINTASRK